MHIPINAKAECTDGPCGCVVSVIVDPKADEVTHIVVRDRGFLHVEHVLPLRDVWAIDDGSLQIGRSRAQVGSLQRFTEIVYVDQADPQVMHAAMEGASDGHIRWAQARPGLEMLMLGAVDVPVEHELVREGEMVLHRGSRVLASTGRMGEVEGLLINLQTGKVTDLVMREGHLWSKHELVLPVAEIERIEDDTIFLRRPRRATKGHDGDLNLDLRSDDRLQGPIVRSKHEHR